MKKRTFWMILRVLASRAATPLSILLLAVEAIAQAALPGPVAVSVARPGPAGPRTARGDSGGATLDYSGRHVAWVSDARDLVSPALVGRGTEVFLKDRETGAVSLVSVALDGQGGAGGDSGEPVLSADDSKVLFSSGSSRLVAGESPAGRSLYLRDLLGATTRRISFSGVDWGSARNGQLSADGLAVVWEQPFRNPGTNGAPWLSGLWQRVRGAAPERIAETANSRDPERAEMDGAGSVVLFHRDLPLPGTLESGAVGTDLWFRRAGYSAPVQVVLPIATNGLFGGVPTLNARVSADGSAIAFRTAAAGSDPAAALGIWWMDLDRGTVVRIPFSSEVRLSADEDASGPGLSADGRTVVFQNMPGDGPFAAVHLWSESKGTLSLHEWAAGAATAFEPSFVAEPVLSPDGGRLAYLSNEAHPVAGVPVGGTVHAYVRVLANGSTRDLGQVGEFDDVVLQFASAEGWLSLETAKSLAGVTDVNDASDVVVTRTSASESWIASLSSEAPTSPTAGLGDRPSLLTSQAGAMSDDGRRVVFQSAAENLVAGDANGAADAFVRDLVTGETIALAADAGGATPSGGSRYPVISADGRRAAFLATTTAWALGDTNTGYKVFVRDLALNRVVLASAPDQKGAGGGFSSANPILSANGHRVLFEYLGGDLGPKGVPAFNLFVRDLDTQRTYPVTLTGSGAPAGLNAANTGTGRMNAEGTRVMFLAARTPYLFRLPEQTTERIGSDEFQLLTGALECSGDGSRAVLFGRLGSPLSHTLAWYDVENRSNHVLFRAPSRTNAISSIGMSRDGSRLFYAGNFAPSGEPLAAGVLGSFVYEISSGQWQRIGATPSGKGSGGTVDSVVLSADGSVATFRARAGDLVAGDENESSDVFVQDLRLGAITLLSRSPKTGRSGNQLSSRPSISADGSQVAFLSFADDLVNGDGNGFEDVFLAPVPRWLRLFGARQTEAGGVEVHWLVPPGVTSRLEWSSSLDSSAVWEPVPVDAAAGTDPIATEAVRAVPLQGRVRFLRVRSL